MKSKFFILLALIFGLSIHESIGQSQNVTIRAYRFSQAKVAELSILNYIEPKYYENYAISTELLVANLIVHTALFGLLLVLLISLKGVTPKSRGG